MKQTRVVNISDYTGSGVYIGRSSIHGNPFRLRNYSRHDSMLEFERYLRERTEADKAYYHATMALEGETLICHCKPLGCHGDVIVRWIAEQLAKDLPS